MSHKQTRCIVHFDILGFSGLVKNDSRKAWEILNNFYLLISRITQQEIHIAHTTQKITSRCKTVFFSDTLIIYTEQDGFEDMFTVFMSATNIFFHAMLLFGIPLRGGIAHGDFFVDTSKSLYMGMPLINAYKTGEETRWLGFVVEDDVYELILRKRPEIRNEQYFVEWNVPLKDEKTKKRIVVNWPHIFQQQIPSQKSPKDFFEYFGFNKLFGKYENLDKDAQDIYENTHIFLKNQTTH